MIVMVLYVMAFWIAAGLMLLGCISRDVDVGSRLVIASSLFFIAGCLLLKGTW